MRDLSTNPIFIQELEIRSRFPAAYRGFLYEGPRRALVLLGVPTFILAVVWLVGNLGREVDPHLLWAVSVVYSLYLAYAAARLGGGSIAVDRQKQGLGNLRMLPLSVWDIFLGKYLGSLLPLFLEVVLVSPIFFILAALGVGPMSCAFVLTAFNLGIVALYGLMGMYWSARSLNVESAVTRARMTVSLMLWVLPFARVILEAFCPPVRETMDVFERLTPYVGSYFLVQATGTESFHFISLFAMAGGVATYLMSSIILRLSRD